MMPNWIPFCKFSWQTKARLIYKKFKTRIHC